MTEAKVSAETSSEPSSGSSPPSGGSEGGSQGERQEGGGSQEQEIPSPQREPGTIVICTLVTIGTSLVKDAASGHPTIKPAITGGILGMALLLLDEFIPTIARMLAICVMIGSLVTNGPELFKVLGRIG